jgi:hypothetical protein
MWAPKPASAWGITAYCRHRCEDAGVERVTGPSDDGASDIPRFKGVRGEGSEIVALCLPTLLVFFCTALFECRQQGVGQISHFHFKRHVR